MKAVLGECADMATTRMSLPSGAKRKEESRMPSSRRPGPPSFQKNTPKQRWEFAPNSSWIAFTDCVSHAVLSGQFALEQTFLIPQSALVSPHRSPLAILEFILAIVKVELLSGKALREPGVSYQCHLSGGKHTCVEKDIEIVPMQKLVTVLPEDTFGISKVLSDYVVETTLHRVAQSSTKIEISHYYSTPTLKAKLLNLIARRRIARETQDTLNGMKAAIEERGAATKNG